MAEYNERYFLLKKDCYKYKYDKRNCEIMTDSQGNIKFYDKQIACDLASNMTMHNYRYRYIAISDKYLSDYTEMIKKGDLTVFGAQRTVRWN